VKYLVIYDYGHEGYGHTECDTYDELLYACYDISSGVEVHEVYEVSRTIEFEELEQYKSKRVVEKAQAVKAALAKLTPEEIELLGIR